MKILSKERHTKIETCNHFIERLQLGICFKLNWVREKKEEKLHLIYSHLVKWSNSNKLLSIVSPLEGNTKTNNYTIKLFFFFHVL